MLSEKWYFAAAEAALAVQWHTLDLLVGKGLLTPEERAEVFDRALLESQEMDVTASSDDERLIAAHRTSHLRGLWDAARNSLSPGSRPK